MKKSTGFRAFFLFDVKLKILPINIRVENIILRLCSGIIAIGEYAFSDCTSLGTVTIPASVKYMSDTVFNNSKKITIYGTDGSFIQEYAENTGITFREISESEQAESETGRGIILIIIGAIATLGIGFAFGRLSKRG
jgi:hypothetical protein